MKRGKKTKAGLWARANTKTELGPWTEVVADLGT